MNYVNNMPFMSTDVQISKYFGYGVIVLTPWLHVSHGQQNGTCIPIEQGSEGTELQRSEP